MWGRAIGVFATLGLVGYMFHMMNSSDSTVQKAIDKNPTTQAQKEMLKQEGIDPNDPDAVKKYAAKKAKEIDDYQHSADGLIGDDAEKKQQPQQPAPAPASP